ncbi:MAG: hypothetical protein NW223_09800 [Hyphomicrobiaceae bacterium]|nr:hypothetical protein [Hyphomicrobiaceae bacterium]
MELAEPPHPDDEDAYIFVDHRDEEAGIVEQVAARLAPAHALAARDSGEDLLVSYGGAEYRIPLTISRHDRYVAISSLAELLEDDYRFFVLKPSLESDTHGLLVVPVAQARAWRTLPEHLVPLERGYDYFGRINIPYLHHEDAAPHFADESAAARAASNAMGRMIESLVTGKMDPAASTELARAAMLSREVRAHPDFPKTISEGEIAAEIQKALGEAMHDPEVAQARREMDSAMQELHRLIRPKKPWWKFW